MESAAQNLSPATVPFLGIDLISVPTPQFSQHILASATTRTQPVLIGYLNAHTFNLTRDDEKFEAALRKFTHLYPDGQAVVWASGWLGQPVAERINAADFIGDFLRQCAESGIKIGLVGGREGEAQQFADHHRSRSPNLNFTAIHHGYFSNSDEPQVLSSIQDSDCRIVLVGMGSPRQEEFVLRASARDSGARIWWCVGALFEYDSQTRARAPLWMRRAGLEWLFRLAMEPRRMWRRYVIGNPKFIWRVYQATRSRFK